MIIGFIYHIFTTLCMRLCCCLFRGSIVLHPSEICNQIMETTAVVVDKELKVLGVRSKAWKGFRESCQRIQILFGNGLAKEAIMEAAGLHCVVPGQTAPIKLLRLKVWPIELDRKFAEPVGRQLKNIEKYNSLQIQCEVVLMVQDMVHGFSRRSVLH